MKTQKHGQGVSSDQSPKQTELFPNPLGQKAADGQGTCVHLAETRQTHSLKSAKAELKVLGWGL